MTNSNNKDLIDVTGVDLIKFAQKVYDLSQPQGLGLLHYTKDPLTAEEAKAYIHEGEGWTALMMDYVKGRACKMTVFRKEGKLWIRGDWYDHSDWALEELLKILK